MHGHFAPERPGSKATVRLSLVKWERTNAEGNSGKENHLPRQPGATEDLETGFVNTLHAPGHHLEGSGRYTDLSLMAADLGDLWETPPPPQPGFVEHS